MLVCRRTLVKDKVWLGLKKVENHCNKRSCGAEWSPAGNLVCNEMTSSNHCNVFTTFAKALILKKRQHPTDLFSGSNTNVNSPTNKMCLLSLLPCDGDAEIAGILSVTTKITAENRGHLFANILHESGGKHLCPGTNKSQQLAKTIQA